jgi:hypothetical protein
LRLNDFLKNGKLRKDVEKAGIFCVTESRIGFLRSLVIPDRACLAADTIQAVMCLKHWYHSDILK